MEIHTVSTLVEYNWEILILHRKNSSSQGGTWGLPAGQPKEGEDLRDTAVRELFEETGHKALPEDLEKVRDFNWHFSDITLIFHTYRLKLDNAIKVSLNSHEHTEFRWITPKQCHAMNNLVHGFHDLLEKIYIL